MADKQLTLEELARAEQATAEQRAAKSREYLDGQRRLLVDTPARYFTLARQLKEGVSRFNGAAKLERVLRYSESAAVTTRDTNPNADFVVEVRRDPNWLVLALRMMWRLRADDAYAIQAEGCLGAPPEPDRVALRIQGVYHGAELRWRVTSDGRNVDTPIDELADRMVAAVATGELARLWTKAPFVDRPRK